MSLVSVFLFPAKSLSTSSILNVSDLIFLRAWGKRPRSFILASNFGRLIYWIPGAQAPENSRIKTNATGIFLSGTDIVSRVRVVSGGSVVVGQLLGWVLKKPRD